MSGLVQPTSRADSFARAPHRFSYRSADELAIRDVVETWGRARWPGARCCHELVVGRGANRADVAFFQPAHFAAIEIKSRWDDSSRLLNQVCMFRLVAPELWVVCDERHGKDVRLAAYLIPSFGIAIASGPPEEKRIEVQREPGPFRPDPEAMLSLLWVAELTAEARRAGLYQGGKKPATHASLVKTLLHLPEPAQLAAVCRQLRGRVADWRADPPIADVLNTAAGGQL